MSGVKCRKHLSNASVWFRVISSIIPRSAGGGEDGRGRKSHDVIALDFEPLGPERRRSLRIYVRHEEQTHVCLIRNDPSAPHGKPRIDFVADLMRLGLTAVASPGRHVITVAIESKRFAI